MNKPIHEDEQEENLIEFEEFSGGMGLIAGKTRFLSEKESRRSSSWINVQKSESANKQATHAMCPCVDDKRKIA